MERGCTEIRYSCLLEWLRWGSCRRQCPLSTKYCSMTADTNHSCRLKLDFGLIKPLNPNWTFFFLWLESQKHPPMKSRDSADFVGYMISDEPPQEAMETSQDHELKLSSRQSFFGRCALIWMVGIWRNFFCCCCCCIFRLFNVGIGVEVCFLLFVSGTLSNMFWLQGTEFCVCRSIAPSKIEGLLLSQRCQYFPRRSAMNGANLWQASCKWRSKIYSMLLLNNLRPRRLSQFLTEIVFFRQQHVIPCALPRLAYVPHFTEKRPRADGRRCIGWSRWIGNFCGKQRRRTCVWHWWRPLTQQQYLPSTNLMCLVLLFGVWISKSWVDIRCIGWIIRPLKLSRNCKESCNRKYFLQGLVW